MPIDKKTGATKGSLRVASPRENVRSGVSEDVTRVKKAAQTKAKGAARQAVVSGAKRAATRLASRAGAVGAAGAAGFDIGTALNKKFKISDKIVDAISPSGKESGTPNVDSKGKSTKIVLKAKRTITKSAPKAAPKKTALQKAQEFAKSGGVFTGSGGAAKKKSPSKTRVEFNKTFKSARDAGVKDFEFRGKRFDTKLK